MKILTFYNQKGGVGKTTLNMETAVYLSKKGLSVLLIDTDSQKNCTTYLLEKENGNKSLANLITKDGKIKDNLVKTKKNLFLLPSDENTSEAIEYLVTKPLKEFFMMGKLAEIENEFDICIFDLPPSKNSLTFSILGLINYIYIVLKQDLFSLEGVENAFNVFKKYPNYPVFKEVNRQISGLVINMVKKSATSVQAKFEEAGNLSGSKTSIFLIPDSTQITHAQYQKKFIVETKKNKKNFELKNSVTKIMEYTEKLIEKE